jgi:uncharacterized protein (TIGR02996 family)
VTPVPTPTLRQALEDALAENPDDLAAHSAYADLLTEQGDPRGEFISVQLALEDESKSPAERQRLHQRETELLNAHPRDWLGELAPLLITEPGEGSRHQPRTTSRGSWARGWVDALHLWWIDRDCARALLRCPAARLLRRLHIEHCMYSTADELANEDRPEDERYPDFDLLRSAPFLPHLRTFQLGETVDFEDDTYDSSHTGMDGVADLIGLMPRLEELYLLARNVALGKLFALPNLTNLRVLQVYHHCGEYPLKALARNPALGRLTTLRLHPAFSDEGSFLPRDQVRALLKSRHLPSLTHLHLHSSDLGNEGCQDIVRSGILKRLKVLDLRHGCIQDQGARTLAACPVVKRLELLSLELNELTDEGVAALSALGTLVRCEGQHEVGSNEYLWSGDME